MLRPRNLNPTGSPAQGADDTLRRRAIAAYLGLAIGDALGATVEFMTPNEIRHKFGEHREMVGGGWLKLKPGQVTDDTSMSLALGEAILANGRVDALATARAFDAWMRAKPVDIGNTVRRNLISWRRSGEPEAPPSEHDAGNGAAMRVLPLALATYGHPPDEIVAASRAQAHVTHNNELSDAACETLVAMLHAYFADDPAAAKRHIATLVENRPQYAHDRKRCENPSGYVVDTLHAVFQALAAHNDFEGCLIDVVNRGGDADTTGAIAGMLAGARAGLEAIPPRWLKALDPQVRSQCETQAVALLVRVARRHA